MKKKWCDFVRFLVFLARQFLCILSSDFNGAACRTSITYTNRKYWCCECRTWRTCVYAHRNVLVTSERACVIWCGVFTVSLFTVNGFR